MTDETKNCIEQAERFLILREHNHSELIVKLKQKKYSQAAISETIEFLEETDELNEERYVRLFIQSNNRRHPEGKNLVFQRLLQKGADRSLSRRILNEVYTDEYVTGLIGAAYAKANNGMREVSDKQIIEKLAKSGFGYSKIAKFLDDNKDKIPN